MREQYDTTGLHPVKLEFPDVGYRATDHHVGGARPGIVYEAPAEPTVEERSELADRRWWRRVSSAPAFAVESPTLATRHMRRAAKAGLAAERVELMEVAERDGWKCGICGKRVVKTARGRRSASLDHIVPVACGGGNRYSNVQLVHLECNWAKKERDLLPSQMRLF